MRAKSSPLRFAALALLLVTGCIGGTQACPFDGGPNPSACASTWAAARERCDAPRDAGACAGGLECWYLGAGDATSCGFGTALAACVTVDAGLTEWRCAQ